VIGLDIFSSIPACLTTESTKKYDTEKDRVVLAKVVMANFNDISFGS